LPENVVAIKSLSIYKDRKYTEVKRITLKHFEGKSQQRFDGEGFPYFAKKEAD
jgi:hypothetical protein